MGVTRAPHSLLGHTALLRSHWLNTRLSDPKRKNRLSAVSLSEKYRYRVADDLAKEQKDNADKRG